jgi:hypothetical protein
MGIAPMLGGDFPEKLRASRQVLTGSKADRTAVASLENEFLL